MDIDHFIHDNVDYYRLFAMDPVCFEVNIPGKGEFWYHADDNCGGDIYIGNNCHLLCRKCMKEAPVNMVRFASPTKDPNVSQNLISFDGHIGKSSHFLSLIGQMKSNCEPKWLNDFVKAGIKMLQE